MTFNLLQSIEIADGSVTRRIGPYEGQLTDVPPEHRADILIISAFPNDYSPSLTSLIGALHRKGLSVRELASAKAHDLRETSAFWISAPIPATALNFGRIACFEPQVLGSPPTVVGNLFRGLFPFPDDRKSQVVAMPLLATGDQGFPPETMLRSILDAAVHWLARGLPIAELKIVEWDSDRATRLAEVMADFKSKLSPPQLGALETQSFDVFLSFSSQDGVAADVARNTLAKANVQRRIFDFRLQIDKGKSWQDEIDCAISSCNAIIAILSPSYFHSLECKEELMQARLHNKRASRPILFPVYWQDCKRKLDLWLQVLNYADCRECGSQKLAQVVNQFPIG